MCSLYIYACVCCVFTHVLHGMGGTGRLTHHRTISKKKLRDTVFLLNLALRKGAEPGEERYLYFPLTPSWLHSISLLLFSKKSAIAILLSNGIYIIKNSFVSKHQEGGKDVCLHAWNWGTASEPTMPFLGRKVAFVSLRKNAPSSLHCLLCNDRKRALSGCSLGGELPSICFACCAQ